MTTSNSTRRIAKTEAFPGYIEHADFRKRSAARVFAPMELLESPIAYDDRYMPDDITRDHARRMHYAAYRLRLASSQPDQQQWHETYFGLRDRIVLGNRKLVYRAVRRRMYGPHPSDDMIGDCQIVMIQAVAAFNPWLGIRFSTYAYTCLVRALSRSSRKVMTDWLARSLTFDSLPDGEPSEDFVPPRIANELRIDEFLRDDHPLLTEREKAVIARRFSFDEKSGDPTLEQVGREVGLSKERVRQVQAIAIGKLRSALQHPSSAS